MKGRFSYSVGERVRIKVGPFQNFTGRVTEVDDAKAIIRVKVEIFGRTQPVELRSVDVEKLKLTEEE
jgi:transcriptional antiterminator NusG